MCVSIPNLFPTGNKSKEDVFKIFMTCHSKQLGNSKSIIKARNRPKPVIACYSQSGRSLQIITRQRRNRQVSTKAESVFKELFLKQKNVWSFFLKFWSWFLKFLTQVHIIPLYYYFRHSPLMHKSVSDIKSRIFAPTTDLASVIGKICLARFSGM